MAAVHDANNLNAEFTICMQLIPPGLPPFGREEESVTKLLYKKK